MASNPLGIKRYVKACSVVHKDPIRIQSQIMTISEQKQTSQFTKIQFIYEVKER
ncbi:hypothetical protein Hanom_Chr09g00854941 [Helianthus anomalus]